MKPFSSSTETNKQKKHVSTEKVTASNYAWCVCVCKAVIQIIFTHYITSLDAFFCPSQVSLTSTFSVLTKWSIGNNNGQRNVAIATQLQKFPISGIVLDSPLWIKVDAKRFLQSWSLTWQKPNVTSQSSLHEWRSALVNQQINTLQNNITNHKRVPIPTFLPGFKDGAESHSRCDRNGGWGGLLSHNAMQKTPTGRGYWHCR